MLKRSSERRHHCFVHNLSRKALNFSTLIFWWLVFPNFVPSHFLLWWNPEGKSPNCISHLWHDIIMWWKQMKFLSKVCQSKSPIFSFNEGKLVSSRNPQVIVLVCLPFWYIYLFKLLKSLFPFTSNKEKGNFKWTSLLVYSYCLGSEFPLTCWRQPEHFKEQAVQAQFKERAFRLSSPMQTKNTSNKHRITKNSKFSIFRKALKQFR